MPFDIPSYPSAIPSAVRRDSSVFCKDFGISFPIAVYCLACVSSASISSCIPSSNLLTAFLSVLFKPDLSYADSNSFAILFMAIPGLFSQRLFVSSFVISVYFWIISLFFAVNCVIVSFNPGYASSIDLSIYCVAFLFASVTFLL